MNIFGDSSQEKKKDIKERNWRKNELKKKKDRVIRDIRTIFEQQEEDYYKPKRKNYFWNNSYIEYVSNGDKNWKLSLDGYPNKSESYLRNIVIDMQNSDTRKILFTITINFISSKNAKEKPVMCSSSLQIYIL